MCAIDLEDAFAGGNRVLRSPSLRINPVRQVLTFIAVALIIFLLIAGAVWALKGSCIGSSVAEGTLQTVSEILVHLHWQACKPHTSNESRAAISPQPEEPLHAQSHTNDLRRFSLRSRDDWRHGVLQRQPLRRLDRRWALLGVHSLAEL